MDVYVNFALPVCFSACLMVLHRASETAADHVAVSEQWPLCYHSNAVTTTGRSRDHRSKQSHVPLSQAQRVKPVQSAYEIKLRRSRATHVTSCQCYSDGADVDVISCQLARYVECWSKQPLQLDGGFVRVTYHFKNTRAPWGGTSSFFSHSIFLLPCMACCRGNRPETGLAFPTLPGESTRADMQLTTTRCITVWQCFCSAIDHLVLYSTLTGIISKHDVTFSWGLEQNHKLSCAPLVWAANQT